MSLLLSHQLSPAAKRTLATMKKEAATSRVTKRAKAALAILRTRDMLGLTDEDLCYAVSIVLERAPERLDIQISIPSETVKFNRGEQ